ncbi:MAG: alpha/beta hydrolase [Aeromicrobium sp.]
MTTHPGKLVPGTEPLTIDGGRIGVLLSHGFTGSPASMIPWGRDLAQRGYTVSVPRLPGHGTTWKDMNTKGWEDWYGEVDRALTELRSKCDQVVVAGLSMGGCLALRLAENRSDDVDALILVNPVVNLANKALLAVPVLKYVVPAMPGIGNDIKKPGMDEIGYDKTPLRALASQLKMWKDVKADLAKVTQPLLFFRSDDDHVVDATSMDIILNGVSSETADFVALHDSYHVATIDNDAQLIFDTSADFIEAHVGAARG